MSPLPAPFARTAWETYNLSATLSVRRFAATYRRHVAMLGLFVFLVLTASATLLSIASSAVDRSGSTGLEDSLTPGAVASAAFVLLLARALFDTHRAVLRDRALWTVLTSPAEEGAVRVGLLLRGTVLQMGLVAAVLTLVATVLASTPEPLAVPRETGPLVALAGLVSGVLALPLLASATAVRRGRDRLSSIALLAVAGVFFASLQLEWPVWTQLSSGMAVVIASAAWAAWGPPALATAWDTANRPREVRRRGRSPTAPLLRLVELGLDGTSRALVRREVQLTTTPRQRLTFVVLNLAMCSALITLDGQLRDLVSEGLLSSAYYHWLTAPFLVIIGIYAVGFFQVTAPLMDAFTKEGPSLWVLKTSPAEPRAIVEAKVRPLLVFLPITVLAVGLAAPLAAGRGPVALSVAALGTVGVYLAFAGIGAWAGAAYPNIDRHTNAPPDLVLAFNLMVACLVVEAVVLMPLVAVDPSRPVWSIGVGMVSVLIGWGLYRLGLSSGGRALARLELAS